MSLALLKDSSAETRTRQNRRREFRYLWSKSTPAAWTRSLISIHKRRLPEVFDYQFSERRKGGMPAISPEKTVVAVRAAHDQIDRA